MKVFLWTPNYPICGTVDRLVSTTDDNRRQQKNAFSQAQGNALCGVPTGTPGITRILLYILYAKYLLCRVSLNMQFWL
jgi:hypothetical protein